MGLLIVLFSLAALVWLIPVIHGGRLFALSGLVLLTGTVLGPRFFAVDSVIELSLDRVLWGALLGLAVIHWRLGNVRFCTLTRIDWVIIGIIGYLLISAISGGNGPYTIKAFSRWLFYFVMPVGLYMIARLVEIRESDVRWLFRVILALAVYLAFTAVCEVTGRHAFVFPKYIVNPEYTAFFGRGRGPLLNPVGNGFVISIGMVLCVFGFFRSERRGKLIYLCVAMLLSAGAYATLTRSVWIGVMLAIGTIAIINTPRWVRVIGLASLMLFGGAMTMGLKDQLISLKRDKHLSASHAAKSIELRPLLAIVAWEMFKDKPITGHGYGRYFEHNKPYSNDRSYMVPLEEVRGYYQHNSFLAIVVDTGLIGLFLFVGILISLAGISWRLARERVSTPAVRQLGLLLMSVLIIYIFNAMFHDMMIIPMVHMFLFFIAGIAVSVYQNGFATSSVSMRQAIPQAMATLRSPATPLAGQL